MNQRMLLFRLVPAAVLSLTSSVILTLPIFHKAISDSRIKEIKNQNGEMQRFNEANRAKGNYADGTINQPMKDILAANDQLIADNKAEIKRIQDNPIDSREMSFIQQLETVATEAMNSRLDLALHGVAWLPFLVIELLPVGLAQIAARNSYNERVGRLEEWRMLLAEYEARDQAENEMARRRVHAIAEAYRHRKTIARYEQLMRGLELESQSARAHHAQAMQEMATSAPKGDETPPAAEYPDPEAADPDPWAEMRPPVATEPEKADVPPPDNGSSPDAAREDFLRRLDQTIGGNA